MVKVNCVSVKEAKTRSPVIGCSFRGPSLFFHQGSADIDERHLSNAFMQQREPLFSSLSLFVSPHFPQS